MNTLYKYQEEDVEWLINHPRAILASEMGLGKTVEAVELCKRINASNILIICPLPVIEVWQKHFNEWWPDHRTRNVVILNYEKLRNEHVCSLLVRVKWDIIIFDEAHKLRSRKSLQAKRATVLAQFNPRVLFITGTPLQNAVPEIWTILHAINRKRYPSFWDFTMRHCYVFTLNKPPFPRIITGVRKSTLPQLRQELSDIMLRRLAKDVVEEIPLITQTIEVTLPEWQQKLYDECVQEIDTQNALAVITKLRQLCLDPRLVGVEHNQTPIKTALLREIVEGRSDSIVLYTYFARYAERLASELGVKCSLYTGQTRTTRDDALKEFLAGKTDVLVATIGTASEGLNLQERSHTVVFADTWWNPKVMDQCIARVRRNGQKHPVIAIETLVKNTVEEKLLHIRHNKTKVFNSVFQVAEHIAQELKEERQCLQKHAQDAATH